MGVQNDNNNDVFANHFEKLFTDRKVSVNESKDIADAHHKMYEEIQSLINEQYDTTKSVSSDK